MGNRKKLLRFLLGMSLLATLMCAVHLLTYADASQPEVRPERTPGYWSSLGQASAAFADHQWITERWVRNDASFASVRSEVEADFAAGQAPAALVTHYEDAAKSDPHDTKSVFAWGCAVKVATGLAAFNLPNQPDYLHYVNAALAEVPSPHSYNYDRLRYMLWYQEVNGWASHYLIGMGQRLLRRNPDDYPVLVDQAMILTQNDDSTARQQGFAMIQQIIKRYPTKPAGYDALACWYDTEMYFTHRADDYQRALAYYQRAETMYPATSARRAQIPGVIQYVRQQYQRLTGT